MLTVTNASGFGAGGGVVPATVSFVDETTDTSNATVYTFTNHAIGTAAGNRKVVVAAFATGSATVSVSSMTIGGVSATERIEEVIDGGGGPGEQVIAFYDLDVVAGTTATIVVTLGRSVNRCHIGVWAVYGAGATPDDLQSDEGVESAADPSVSINCPADGVIIAATGGQGGEGSTHTWVGVTEDFDASSGEVSAKMSGASDEFDTQQTGLTVSVAYSDVLTAGVMVVASYGPA